MTAPTVNTISPASGDSLGQSLVEIIGTDFNLAAIGTVVVFFGTELATEVRVVSSTRLFCRTPKLAPQVVDVTVRNVTPNPPGPDIIEDVVVVDGYEFKRLSIQTRPDFQGDSTIRAMTRQLLKEFQTHVLENTYHDMHSEYPTLEDSLLEQEHQAEAPSIKILGPTLAEDRFYSHNGDVTVEVTPGDYRLVRQPYTVMPTYRLVGLGRTSGEAQNLHRSVLNYFDKTRFLSVPVNGVDGTDGYANYEMDVVREQAGDFNSEATRQANYQFSMSFMLRGVHLLGETIGESKEILDIDLDVQQLD